MFVICSCKSLLCAETCSKCPCRFALVDVKLVNASLSAAVACAKSATALSSVPSTDVTLPAYPCCCAVVCCISFWI